jgi:hypothetical protein
LGIERRFRAARHPEERSHWPRLFGQLVFATTGHRGPQWRNDQLLDVLPIGVMVFPGTGIQGNVADKAKKLGIPVWKFGTGGG